MGGRCKNNSNPDTSDDTRAGRGEEVRSVGGVDTPLSYAKMLRYFRIKPSQIMPPTLFERGPLQYPLPWTHHRLPTIHYQPSAAEYFGHLDGTNIVVSHVIQQLTHVNGLHLCETVINKLLWFEWDRVRDMMSYHAQHNKYRAKLTFSMIRNL